MTALLVGLHASQYRHRPGIERHGLLPNQPAINRPFGVYIFTEDGSFDHVTYSRGGRVRWSSHRGQDLWSVSYFGPATPDAYVENGLVLLDRVIAVTLVTGN